MSSYTGRHADLYDIFYGDKPYHTEALFIDTCFKKFGIGKTERILELACGTGEHAFALEKLGYHVVATDYSADLLTVARDKKIKKRSCVDFRLNDMRELDLPESPFDAAICLFDSIGYVATNESLHKVLTGVNRCLRPDGLFVVEFWHAPAMLRKYEPLRIKSWATEAEEILRTSQTTIECQKQIAEVKYTIYEFHKDGTYSRLEETQRNRYFLVQEMVYFLSQAGFASIAWFAGFNEEDRITDETWHVLAVARKTQEALPSKGIA